MKYPLLPIIAAVALLTVAACGNKKQEYTSADGTTKAVHNPKTDTWTITGPDGAEVVADYDSMRVVQVSEEGNPMTVVYYRAGGERWVQYYTTMQLRSEGDVVNGRREGRWVFYHPNGNIQSECTFSNGLEEGPYRVYRENGVPYYIGQYTNGQRTGRWEVYDNDGNLADSKTY